jgi:hypothetical protein
MPPGLAAGIITKNADVVSLPRLTGVWKYVCEKMDFSLRVLAAGRLEREERFLASLGMT